MIALQSSYSSKRKLLPPLSWLFLVSSLVLIRVFLRGYPLELDEAEQIVLAQDLLPGYPDQPPLYSWLQYLVFKGLGANLLSLALLKSCLLGSCFFCFYYISRCHCRSAIATWCATLAWGIIPAIGYDLLKDNTHSVLALLAACLTWYWFTIPSSVGKKTWYLVLGLMIGIGFLSKFNYFLFLAILLISAISLKEWRLKLIDPAIFLTIITAILLASPYFLWLSKHPQLGLHATYKLVPTTKALWWHGLVALFQSIFFFTAVLLTLAAFLLPIKFSAKQTPFNQLLIRYHLIALLTLLFLLIVLRDFQPRWLIPILFLTPILYCSQLDPVFDLKQKAKRFITLSLIIQFSFIIALIYRSHFSKNRYNQFPLKQLVYSLKSSPIPIKYLIADPFSYWLLGNLKVELSETQSWLLHPGKQFALPKERALVVWYSPTIPSWGSSFFDKADIKWLWDARGRRIAGYIYYDGSRFQSPKKFSTAQSLIMDSHHTMN